MKRKKVSCCEEEVYLKPEVEKELQHRLSRIMGHISGVKRMLQAHKDCDSMLIQMAAIRSAIDQATLKLLNSHMDSCVSISLKNGNFDEAFLRFRTALAHVLKHS